jgi:hypothetical protein
MPVDVAIEQEFLASLVQKVIKDNNILVNLEDEYFSVDSYKWLVRLIKSREFSIPAQPFLGQLLADSIQDEETLAKYSQQLEILYTKELTYSEDVEEYYKKFIADRKLTTFLQKSINSYNGSKRIDLFIRDLETNVSEVKNFIKGDGLKVVDYIESYENRMDTRKKERDNPNLSPVIKTGIFGLDHQFHLKKGMVIDFLAPFKRGKSVLLNSLGFAAFLQGYNICQVIYENSLGLTADRYDSLFTQTSCDRISNLFISKDEKEEIDTLFNWMKTWDNKLYIIKATAGETTAKDIEDQLKIMYDKSGFSPDVLVVDYLNIVGPPKEVAKSEDHWQQNAIFWSIKNLTERLNTLTYTASQSNMEGVKDHYSKKGDKKGSGNGRLKMTSRGRSIGISQGLDLSVAIDQSEEEKEEGIMVLSPHFYRWGQVAQSEIVLDINLEYMTFDKSMLSLWEEAKINNPF